MIDLHQRLLAGFGAAFRGAPDLAVRSPGRVNLIGEHTDYNDGFAMPLAIGMETRLALRERQDGEIRVTALDFGEADTFSIAPDLPKSADGGWRDYVRGTVAILAGAGIDLTGADIAIAGNIPQGAGLSSSASLEVGVATAMLALAGHDMEPRQVALFAQAAENDFVGVRCGNLDQLAAAASVADSALLIDCRSLDLTPVPLPPETVVMIVQSGVTRGLIEGEYNRRRQECEEAAAALGVAALRDVDLTTLNAARDRLRPIVFARARHIVTDNARTLAAAEALASGDLAAMGRLMAESHASQRDDFGITVPATDRLAALMTEAIDGEGGARQTGGGFGGAVIGLMPQARLEAVRTHVLGNYQTPAGTPPDIYIEPARPGASVLPNG